MKKLTPPPTKLKISTRGFLKRRNANARHMSLLRKLLQLTFITLLSAYSAYCNATEVAVCNGNKNLNANNDCLLFAPKNLRIVGTVEPKVYSVQWDTVAGANKYKIEEVEGKAGENWGAAKEASGGVLEVSDTARTINKHYRYRVQACSDGDGCSPFSKVYLHYVGLKPAVITSVAENPAPAALRGIKLTWEINPQATYYKVLLCAAGSTCGKDDIVERRGGDKSITGNTYDLTLPEYKKYPVAVVSCDEQGGESEEDCGIPAPERVQEAIYLPKAAPSGALSSTAPADNQSFYRGYSISWPAYADADGKGVNEYLLEESSDGATWSTAQFTTNGALSANISGKGPSAVFHYRVRSCVEGANAASDASLCGNSVSSTVKAYTAATPSVSASGGIVTLEWNIDSGATRYEFEECTRKTGDTPYTCSILPTTTTPIGWSTVSTGKVTYKSSSAKEGGYDYKYRLRACSRWQRLQWPLESCK